MSRLVRWLVVMVFAVAVGGCAGLERPRLLAPGPAAYQQRRAERFDPYADNEAGPAVVGARPREYDKPFAEPSRARWTIPWMPRR